MTVQEDEDNDTKSITRRKLARQDYGRPQGQTSYEDKKKWMGKYNPIAEENPKNAELIRDYYVKNTMQKLDEIYFAMVNADPSFRTRHYNYLVRHVHDKSLLNEMLNDFGFDQRP